jgi:hypothetical protein
MSAALQASARRAWEPPSSTSNSRTMVSHRSQPARLRLAGGGGRWVGVWSNLGGGFLHPAIFNVQCSSYLGTSFSGSAVARSRAGISRPSPHPQKDELFPR